MPNWFYFTLNVSGEEKDVQEFVENVKGTEKFETEGREFDFNHFIPQPDNIFRDPLSSDKEKELDELGIPSWYTWNIVNWDTKWNANVECEYGDGGDYHTYEMATAWAFPESVMRKMIEMYPKLNFHIVGDEESGAYGIYWSTVEDTFIAEEPTTVDEANGREVYWDSKGALFRYTDDNTEVPDQGDFYPMNKYSWS